MMDKENATSTVRKKKGKLCPLINNLKARYKAEEECKTDIMAQSLTNIELLHITYENT